jgi:hypothetical protein
MESEKAVPMICPDAVVLMPAVATENELISNK